MNSKEVAKLTGYSVRWVNIMAGRGEIPGAHQIREFSHWKFDGNKVRLWWASKERREQWRPSINVGKYTGDVSSISITSSAEALEQFLNGKPKRACKN